jgi:hypothetical protein
MLSSHENPTNYSDNERHECMRKQITVKKKKKKKKEKPTRLKTRKGDLGKNRVT